MVRTRQASGYGDVADVFLNWSDAHCFVAERLDTIEGGSRSCNGRHDTDVVRVGGGTDLVLVFARDHAAGCVDDQLDLSVLDIVIWCCW